MNAKYILAAVLLAGSAATQAAVLFSDNFNAETLGLDRTPSNFTLVAGRVDVIGAGGPFDILPGNGRYIDLDGSINQGGTIRRDLFLNAGVTYTASFDLAGSQRGDTNVVTVGFGLLPPVAFTRFSSDPFAMFQLVFTPLTTGTFALSFANGGGDNRGALLDDVLVAFPTVVTPAVVSEPESVALMLAGLGIGGLVSRRRVQRA